MAATSKTAAKALLETVFNVEVPNHELLKLVYGAYLANGRTNHAKTLRRGEVSGGGKKPWKQKGTGRARFGSSRNPIWRKGGVVFGPLGNENYSKTVAVRTKRVALRQALTLSHKSGSVVIIDDVTTTGKTKDITALLAAQDITKQRNILLVVDHKTPELTRATNNLEGVQLTQATYLSVFSIMNADRLLVTKAALTEIEKWLGA
ncbi:MAG TPA: 50S ribosomal protein L4 [Patescibacteria group bacterium]|jgi:large subunit ribosomal protein L4|nr:50S ribosomal protein L4 [Patescibacteria group bacterium]